MCIHSGRMPDKPTHLANPQSIPPSSTATTFATTPGTRPCLPPRTLPNWCRGTTRARVGPCRTNVKSDVHARAPLEPGRRSCLGDGDHVVAAVDTAGTAARVRIHPRPTPSNQPPSHGRKKERIYAVKKYKSSPQDHPPSISS
jgi:hypothetical protein